MTYLKRLNFKNKMAKKGLSEIVREAKRNLGRTLGFSSFPGDMTPEELEVWKTALYLRDACMKDSKEILHFDSYEEARAYKIIKGNPLGRYIIHSDEGMIFGNDVKPYVKGD